MKDLGQEQDGSEIKSRELELLTGRVQNLGDRRDAFETMRDLAAEGYRAETGDTWRPRNGSHSSQTGKLTSAAIDARDYLRARKDRETSAHLPEGTLVAFTGGKDFDDVTAIWRSLDSIKIKYEDMVLLHGGGPGAEKIAASWAGEERRSPGRVQAELGPGRQGRSVPAQRGPQLRPEVASPPASGHPTIRPSTVAPVAHHYMRRKHQVLAQLPAEGPRRLPRIGSSPVGNVARHHQQFDRRIQESRFIINYMCNINWLLIHEFPCRRFKNCVNPQSTQW